MLIAIIFGLVFFWPFDPATLALFAAIGAGGLLGGRLGRRTKRSR
jgi:hypothetical protein